MGNTAWVISEIQDLHEAASSLQLQIKGLEAKVDSLGTTLQAARQEIEWLVLELAEERDRIKP